MYNSPGTVCTVSGIFHKTVKEFLKHMKKKNVAAVLFLTVLTLGVYGLIYTLRLSAECEKTGAVKDGYLRPLQVVFYMIGWVALGAFLYAVIADKGSTMTIIAGAAFVLVRIAAGIYMGCALHGEIRQICTHFSLPVPGSAFGWSMSAVLTPFITVALVQSAFNMAEDKAIAIETENAKKGA